MGGTDIKKIGRLILILALVLTLLPCAAGGESIEEYGEEIKNALDSLTDAFAGDSQQAVNTARQNVMGVVSGAVKYLARIAKYDGRCVTILTSMNHACVSWSEGLPWSGYMEQAYAANYEVFLKGANGAHYVSLSFDSAVLSAPGYTKIPYDIYHNCVRAEATFYACTLTSGNSVIPVKVYDDFLDGDGEEANIFGWSGDLFAYIAEADYQVAAPGTYTGKMGYSLRGYDGGDGHEYNTGWVGGEISLTLVKPGDPVEYVVTAEASPAEGGTVTGIGSCRPGTPVTLTAAAEEHYRFVNWTENGSEVSTEASYTFTPAGDSHLVANFERSEYGITSRYCFVALNGEIPEPLDFAVPGTRLFIWRDYGDPPEGMYWTGGYSVDGQLLPPNEYEFTMPEHDVTADAVCLPQETLTVDLSAGPVPVPGSALYACGDMDWNDPEAFDCYLMDLDGDGTYDLKLVPREEDGTMLVSPLGGMLALSPSVTKNISGEHGAYGTVVFSFTPPAFDSATSDSLLVLPADLDTVEAGAFEGDTAIQVVDASHCMTLGAQAFKGCAGLTKIRLSGTCLIDEHAFDGCTSLYAIYGPAGSDTQAWAEAHYLLFIGE